MARHRRGEIWWAQTPEPSGIRPVLILTRNVMIPSLSNVTVAPLTRKQRHIDSEVEVGLEHGLPSNSVISLDNIITIQKSALESKITSLDEDTMNAVAEAIHFAFELPY